MTPVSVTVALVLDALDIRCRLLLRLFALLPAFPAAAPTAVPACAAFGTSFDIDGCADSVDHIPSTSASSNPASSSSTTTSSACTLSKASATAAEIRALPGRLALGLMLALATIVEAVAVAAEAARVNCIDAADADLDAPREIAPPGLEAFATAALNEPTPRGRPMAAPLLEDFRSNELPAVATASISNRPDALGVLFLVEIGSNRVLALSRCE